MVKMKKSFYKHLVAHMLLIIICIISVFPIVWIFSSSINSDNQLISVTHQIIPSNPTLDHYKQIIFEAPFATWAINSLIMALSTTVLCVVLSTSCAYAYSRFRFKGKETGLWLLLVINAFPNILAIVAYFKILTVLNLVDSRLGLIFIYVGSQLAFTIWNMKGYFDTIPVEIEESATIDGASKLQLFVKIILPLSKPALAVTALLGFMAGWNEYIMAMTFLLSPEKYSLAVGIWTLQQGNAYATNWPLFAAGSLIVALPVAILFFALQKYFVSGLTVGGVKG